MTSTVSASMDAAPGRGTDLPPARWALWQRVSFRFFFIYLLLQTEPWTLFEHIPGISFLVHPYDALVDWAVHVSNAHLFHVRATLVPVNGSGDTSYAWTQLWLFLSVALIGCAIWSVLDRRRNSYHRLLYWLRLGVRYYVASAALSYGIIKLFDLQMIFPSTSQLATPLGDLLPMRFSWLFIGYSDRYQFFSGSMETLAGLLLLYRPTITAGLFAATGAFANVVMINLSYDVPVKLYSMHLLFCCLFLLALDAPRLVNFLLLNRPTPPTDAYTPQFARAWQRWGTRAVKVYLVIELLVLPALSARSSSRMAFAPVATGAFTPGVYDVRSYVVNDTPVPMSGADSIRWKDLIFDSNMSGSINTADSLFQQRYHRGYFRYRTNTVARTVTLWRYAPFTGETLPIFTARYEQPDSSTIVLHTVIRGDSVHVTLARMPRHFQLAERQFHWLSEYNR